MDEIGRPDLKNPYIVNIYGDLAGGFFSHRSEHS